MAQLLRARGASRAGPGYRVHRGPPDRRGSFCQKEVLQQLNGRLASYLQQVQRLQTANQKLTRQIQEQLDRKCPGELRLLDADLRTVTLLQEQISECLSAQAQLKLQLLSAELNVYDFNVRCEKERERGGCVEAELSALRLLEAELQADALPALQTLLVDQTRHLMDLKEQHRQDTRGLLAQLSGGVAVEIRSTRSSDLLRQLDELRRTTRDESWITGRASMFGSAEAPPGRPAEPEAEPEAVRAELREQRSTAAVLERELARLQAQSEASEACGARRAECFLQQLSALQRRADALCGDLDPVLRAATRQAAAHQELLHLNARLQAEILEYFRLLDGPSWPGPSWPGVSGLHSNSRVTSSCGTSSPSAFSRNITVSKAVRVQGGNLLMRVENVPRGHAHTVPRGHAHTVPRGHAHTVPRSHAHTAPTGHAHTDVPVTTVQPIGGHIKAPERSPVSSINTSNLTGSFHKADNQRPGSLSTAVTWQSAALEDEGNAAQGIPTCVQQSARSAAFQTKPSKQATPAAGLQDLKTNIQTQITETVLCAEPEVKEGSGSATTTDPSKGTAAEVKTEPETLGSHQHNCTEDLFQTQNQEPAQVVTLSLETSSEADGDVEEVVVSGAPLWSEDTQGSVSGGSTLINDKDIEREVKKGGEQKQEEQEVDTEQKVEGEEEQEQEHKVEEEQKVEGEEEEEVDKEQEEEGEEEEVEGEEQEQEVDKEQEEEQEQKVEEEEEEEEGSRSNASSSEPDRVMEDAEMGSRANASSGSSDCKDRHETASPELLEKVELEMNEGISGFLDAHEVKVDSTECDNEIVDLPGQEESLSTTKSKQCVSLTDSGVALSSSDHEEVLSPIEAHVFMGPASPPGPETCLSPVETQVLRNVTSQGFCPVDPVEHVQSPDSLLSPRDQEMFFSPNDSDTCFSPVEAKGCLSPNSEEDEVCTSLTEARTHEMIVRPVEKYLLSTKEEGHSPSFSTDQALLEEDMNREVSVSAGHGNSLCFRPIESNDGSRYNLNDTNNSRPSGRGVGLQLSTSLGGFEFGGPGGRSILADKEEELSFGGLYRKSESDETKLRDRYGDTSGIADDKDVQNRSGSAGGRYGDQKETCFKGREVMGQKNSAQVFVKSASFGSAPDNGGTSSQSQGRGVVSYLTASCGGTAANPSSAINSNTEAEGQRGFRRGSGDRGVHGGILGRTATTSDSSICKESASGAKPPGARHPETGRFSSTGSGEWRVYGGSLGRKRSLDDETSSPSEEGKDATSPGRAGRFNSRGSGEWMPYGGSLGRQRSWPRTGSEGSPAAVRLPATSPPDTRRLARDGGAERMVHSSSLERSDSIPITGSKEGRSAATHLPTGPPDTGRFGSGGSGEWRVYGGSTGRMSRAAATESLPDAVREESLSVARRLAMSPPRASRFGSGDAADWRVYGGTSNADRVSVTSPPSSYTSSGPRLGSAGSGGRVVRRSSSVGSGGRLRSSGSGGRLSGSPASRVASSAGRFGSTGSGESKPAYGSASGRSSAAGSAGRPGGARAANSQRAPSPAGNTSAGRPSGAGRVGGSSGSERSSGSGRRVISSSDRPIRSTGSGAGGNRERISVCKMAALSISAAGRERSQEQQQQAQWAKQKQQQQAADASPLVQRWLTSGVGVTSAEPDGLDDIMRL
ncbi:uncharacterized protein [Clinocottus analis]|uniref:uncharacterized protein n=1 Tax=Clinocottus analis TaxID=304258 RepID=UPI0035C1CEDB